MATTSKVDIFGLLQRAPANGWCVVKLPDTFPMVRAGGDVDVFCRSIAEFCDYIMPYALNLAEETGCRLMLQDVMPGRCHVDFIDGGAIDVRLDLCDAVPVWSRVRLKASFFDNVICSAVKKEMRGRDGEIGNIFIPTVIDEAIIRYVEYSEYYWNGIDKMHHLQWIEDSVPVEMRNKLFEKLHMYTEMPHASHQYGRQKGRSNNVDLTGGEIISILGAKIGNRIKDPRGTVRFIGGVLRRFWK